MRSAGVSVRHEVRIYGSLRDPMRLAGAGEGGALAIYYASTTPLSRRSGRSAVAAAAYRAGCRLVDARTGREHDYSRKRGVESSALILPDGESTDRELLWSAAERAEARKDARTAREWVLALPSELGASERVELAHAFALELARRYGVAVDVAIHAPHRHGDDRNFHAHLLCTTRRVERDPALGIVLGAKVAIELGDKDRKRAGIAGRSAHDIEQLRASWAALANGALERAGRSERIDHRSLEEQGIDREPTIHLGPVATQMERRGRESDRGRILRAIRRDNREREQLAARLARMQAELEARERAAQEQAERERAELEAREAVERAALERAAREQAERERIEAMTSAELAAEMHRVMPMTPRERTDAHPEVQRTRADTKQFHAALTAAQAEAVGARSDAELYRRQHSALARLHDLGITQRPLQEFAAAESAATVRAAELEQRYRDALRARDEKEAAISAQIVREMQPVLARHRQLEALRREKREAERALNEFRRLAQRRQERSLGYRDGDRAWLAMPEGLRRMLEVYADASPAKQQRLIEQLKEPRAQQQLRAALHEHRRGRDRDRGR